MRFFIFMRLKINGEVVEGVSASTVQELLDEMKITAGRVAVEVNLSIVRKADYGQCRLNDGDTVEIVNFVGGGAGSSCEENDYIHNHCYGERQWMMR
jgi:thiamine biosynthesis protein ThiS